MSRHERELRFLSVIVDSVIGHQGVKKYTIEGNLESSATLKLYLSKDCKGSSLEDIYSVLNTKIPIYSEEYRVNASLSKKKKKLVLQVS